MRADRNAAAVTEPSACTRTSMRVACPASASSAALSMASWMMCVGSVVTVYMPGRSRTGCRPFSTRIDDSSYFPLANS